MIKKELIKRIETLVEEVDKYHRQCRFCSDNEYWSRKLYHTLRDAMIICRWGKQKKKEMLQVSKDETKGLVYSEAIRRPQWQFVSGLGWGHGNVTIVQAVRFGLDGVFLAKATGNTRLQEGTTSLFVELVKDGRRYKFIKELGTELRYFSEGSLKQHWSRMITAATKDQLGEHDAVS